jgi:hypothetical protein
MQHRVAQFTFVTQELVMERIIVYVDDAAYAQQQLAPIKHSTGLASDAQRPGIHWVLVACAPRLTRHISKWVSHSARENWRKKWSDKLFERVVPPLRESGDAVSTVLARGSLPELTEKLTLEYGASYVLDARRPKFGYEMPPITAEQPLGSAGRWELPGAIMGMGAVLVLAAE